MLVLMLRKQAKTARIELPGRNSTMTKKQKMDGAKKMADIIP